MSCLNLFTVKNCLRIDKNIFVKVVSLAGAIHIIWNLLENLLVISLLPPIGGAAEIKTTES